MKRKTKRHLYFLTAISTLLTTTLFPGCVTTKTQTLSETAYEEMLEGFLPSKASNGMRYSFFSPVKDTADTTRYPLVIYVHGLFHGWTDRSAAKSGLTYWICPEMQEKFKAGGAFLLMPRIPETSVSSLQDGKIFSLISEFLAEYGDSIDQDRIFIMGGSAGGALTWKIISAHPDFFSAAVILAANKRVPASDAEKVSMLPIWMVSAKTDPLVSFSRYQEYNWNSIVKVSAVKDMCRWTVFEDTVTLPDGTEPPFTHFLAKTIGWNFCTISDREPLEGMETITAEGNIVSLSWDDGLIEWLESCASP